MKSFKLAICAGFAALLNMAYAEEMIYSGFMTDYTPLRKVTDGSADYRYTAPGAGDSAESI